jgi:type IV pilus assembly protein PilA
MACEGLLEQRTRKFVKCLGVITMILLVASSCTAQAPAASPSPNDIWLQYMNKYPGLLDEFGRLFEKLSHGLQYPLPRNESRLLQLLPDSTVYLAFPNYGEVTHQALDIFHQELQGSAALRNWWQHSEVAATGPKLEDFLTKFSQFSQYLGPEIAVSGAMQGKGPSVLIVAEVRKPGVNEFLEQVTEELAGKSQPFVRVLDPQELAAASNISPSEKFFVLVRPDFIVGAPELAALRNFSAQLDQGRSGFVSTPFGQRIARSYEGGATTLTAVDLHKIVSQIPIGNPQDLKTFEGTGFADVKYLVWEHKTVAGRSIVQTELSFTGPRRGVAAWLAKPGPMGSLDFASPNSVMLSSVLLTNPGQIFQDVKAIATASNPNAFAALATFEQAVKLNLKDDLLSQLGGELMVEFVSAAPPKPVWRAALRVTDPTYLQQTLNTLLSATHFPAEHSDKAGVTYYSVQIPNPPTIREIVYAFVDGYWLIASSHEALAEAVQLHKSGGSLGKSKEFLASLPPGHESGASALIYQDPLAMSAIRLEQLSPDAAGYLAKLIGKAKPAVTCAYAEETAIRGASTSVTLDAGMVLMVAAISIPNLLRSRSAANEASAVGSIRTVNTAEITYAASYPQRRYAPDLATLGPGPGKNNGSSPDHANLIDASLANASCTAGAWCTKSGYRFSITAACAQKLCKEYVVAATPVSNDTGTRNFCSTSDGIIRFKSGAAITEPINLSECRTWSPLQ